MNVGQKEGVAVSKRIEQRQAAARPNAVALWAFGPEVAQFVVVSLWASTFVVTKAAFAEVSPLAFAFVRFALMTVLAFGVLALRSRGRLQPIQRADLPRFVVAGLTGYTLYQLGFVLGLDRTSPFSSSLLIAMVPFFTLIFLAQRGERTTRRVWVGLGVGLAGVVVFLADKWGSPGSLVGDALSLGAAVAFALYGLVNRPLVRAYPPEAYTAYALLAGAIPLLAISLPAALAQPWGAILCGLHALELGDRAARCSDGQHVQSAGADPEWRPLSAALWGAVRPREAARRGMRPRWTADRAPPSATCSSR